MKIIKKGKLPKTYQATCSRCKCVYEFHESEARIHSEQTEGDTLITACPTCNHKICTFR